MAVYYWLRKILYGFSVLWGVITLVFILFNVLPDDPARLTLGQRSDLASVENVRKELNLDKPVLTRYFLYLNDLSPLACLRRDTANVQKYGQHISVPINQHWELALKKPYMGRSYQSKRLVWDILSDALPGTILLALSATLLATVAGIGLGVLAALKKGTWLDTAAIFTSVGGIYAPTFFAGLLIA